MTEQRQHQQSADPAQLVRRHLTRSAALTANKVSKLSDARRGLAAAATPSTRTGSGRGSRLPRSPPPPPPPRPAESLLRSSRSVTPPRSPSAWPAAAWPERPPVIAATPPAAPFTGGRPRASCCARVLSYSSLCNARPFIGNILGCRAHAPPVDDGPNSPPSPAPCRLPRLSPRSSPPPPPPPPLPPRFSPPRRR